MTWRNNQHTDRPGTTCVTVETAIRIASRYTTTPSPRRLMSEMGMSQATAYRWVRAMKDARGEV